MPAPSVCRPSGFAIALTLILSVTAVVAQYPDAPERGALLEIDDHHRGAVGLRADLGKREIVFQDDDAVTDLHSRALVIEGAYDPLPWFGARAEIGWIQADLGEEDDGEGGIQWGAGLDLNLVERILSGSPAAPRKRALTLNVLSFYRHHTSNRSGGDLDWRELSVEPAIVYAVNQRSDLIDKRGIGDRYTLRAGLAFSDISGSFGETDLEEERNFGAVFGCSAGFLNNVSLTLNLKYYSGSDTQLGLAITQAW